MVDTVSLRRSLTQGAVAVLALTVGIGATSQTVWGKGEEDATSTEANKNKSPEIELVDEVSSAGDVGAGGWNGAPPRRSTFCDGANARLGVERVAGTDAQPVGFSLRSEGLGLFRYSDGRSDRKYEVNKIAIGLPKVDPAIVGAPWPLQLTPQTRVNKVVDPGSAPTHELHRVWCARPAAGGEEVASQQEIWIPLPTPESVAERADLFAKVTGRLSSPAVSFVDSDIDHGWLYVHVDHHLVAKSPVPVEESATIGYPGWGSATAWIRASPVSLEVRFPTAAGVEHVASCDLTKATSSNGCKIRFTHASSVAPDGWFDGVVALSWAVASNSGKYDGVGPLMTTSRVRVQVAEAMAVGRPGS